MKLGKSRSHITNMLGLLNLPEEVKDMIVDNKLSMSHARVLSKMEDKDEVIRLAQKIVTDNLNVRDLEEESRKDGVKKIHEIKKNKVNEYSYVENVLCDKLGTRVRINNNKINISFNNVNDLNRILEIMNIDV